MDTDFCYFCIQLPDFPPGATPPLPLDDFDALLGAVSPADANYIRACSFPPPAEAKYPKNSAAAQFRAFEESLRYDVACFRAAKFGISPPSRPRGVRPVEGLFARIESIAGLDPLEREKQLDRIRSTFLETLAAGNRFSRDAAACYRFRLALGWREKEFGDPSGREIFRGTVDAIEREFVGGPEVSESDETHRQIDHGHKDSEAMPTRDNKGLEI